MVRLERVLWERALNIKAFGREREIKSPRKWHHTKRSDYQQVLAYKVFRTGLSGALFPYVEPLLAYMFYSFPRDFLLQRGLAYEDAFLHHDRELRRCVFFEHVVRTSCHPYQTLMPRKRRARYYKVERAHRGFYVPDYIRREAEERTVLDFARNKEVWDNFLHDNFAADMTPTLGNGRKFILYDFLQIFGLLKADAWDRFFFNEASFEEVTKEELAETEFRRAFDVTSPEGRTQFERYVKRYMALYPGALVPEGKEFDFPRFYAGYAVANGLETAQYDQNLIGELRQKLDEAAAYAKEPTGEKATGKNNVGTQFPTALASRSRRAFMNTASP